MNPFKVAYCRIFQAGLALSMCMMKIPLPALREGEGCSLACVDDLKALGKKRPLFFVEEGLRKVGLSKKLEEALNNDGIECIFFTNIKPNPTDVLVEEAKQIYLQRGCDSLIALGGGSTIDLAKAVGVLVTYPDKKIDDFAGILKIHRQIPPLLAIPTTCGTGSETTVASVIVNEKNKDKYQIDSPYLVPAYAYLDGSLLAKLPPKVIAMTGMDALTHALEAYIGRANTKYTKQCALDAFDGIRKYLYRFYSNQSDIEARIGMLKASFDAGNAFTRAFIGYVHALAHALGGAYNIAHGLANAILLPYVIRCYGKSINGKSLDILCALGVSYKDGEPPYETLATYIDQLNEKMGIPKTFSASFPKEDIPSLCKHALKEANPLYPVPVLFDQATLEKILTEARG